MDDETLQVEKTAGLAGAQVLVSGGSFAGLATAWWLNWLGCRVTVVEVAGALRKGGTPVDIEGETIAILDRMGLLEAVRAMALPPRTVAFKNGDDSTVGVMEHDPGSSGERYEIHRDDLLNLLSAAIEGSVEMVFDRSIVALDDGPDRVSVTLNDSSKRDYALVIGCDGNRSNTRKLAFGEDADFSHFMGCYGFLKVVPDTGLLPANLTEIFSVPGRTAMLNGYQDRTDVGLVFRSDVEIDYDYRDRARQRRLIHDHCDGLGWKVPAVLDHLDADDDFYFDRINQIRMPAWSKGRVVLVGDAGYCVSPLAGMGGSMAIIGAAGLANALERHGSDHQTAFQEYHEKLRPFVDDVQDRAVCHGLTMMFPADEAAMEERNRRISTAL